MSTRSLAVAVLGAAGTIAPAIIRDLAVSEEVGSMLLLDLDGERAVAAADAHGGGKAIGLAVDARDAARLKQELDGIDALVNTASYRINLETMRACLAAGCHYLDLGGLYWMTKRQLELDADFRRAGRIAVLGIGSSPGKTNLMAARALRDLAAPPEEIEIAAAGRDPEGSDDGRLHPPYAIQTLLDELTLAPVVLRNGQPVEIEPLSDGGAVDFGDPIGEADTIYTLHSELATFGESFGCRNAGFKLSLAPRLLAGLRDLVGAPADAVAQAAREAVPPSPHTASVHVVTVRDESGSTVRARAVTRPHFGLGGSIVSTAAPIAAAVRLLARGEIEATGALPPERCLDPDLMFAELETRACAFGVD